MTNPFDDENATYVVLVNDEEQYSLWPVLIDVPGGWRVVHPADSREACIDFINRNWTDMRPKTLRSAALGSRMASTSSEYTQEQKGRDE